MRARPVYFIQLGWLGFKEGEGELKLRLKIGYHNSLGVSQSLDMLESTSGFRTDKKPELNISYPHIRDIKCLKILISSC